MIIDDLYSHGGFDEWWLNLDPFIKQEIRSSLEKDIAVWISGVGETHVAVEKSVLVEIDKKLDRMYDHYVDGDDIFEDLDFIKKEIIKLDVTRHTGMNWYDDEN
jgi:hypothetical protein